MEADNSVVTSSNQSHELNPDLVQVRAGKEEINRRISAFIERKRLVANEKNLCEFISVNNILEDGCARTNAIFNKFENNRTSRIKVYRAKHRYGPLNVQAKLYEDSKNNNPPLIKSHGLEERLKNLEDYMNVDESEATHTVFTRLKKIEERLLELESQSPEYFDNNFKGTRHEIPRQSNDKQLLVASDIDEQINQLKRSLIDKTVKSECNSW